MDVSIPRNWTLLGSDTRLDSGRRIRWLSIELVLTREAGLALGLKDYRIRICCTLSNAIAAPILDIWKSKPALKTLELTVSHGQGRRHTNYGRRKRSTNMS